MKKYFLLVLFAVVQLIAAAQSKSLSDSIQQLLRGAAASSQNLYPARTSSIVSQSVYNNAIKAARMKQVLSNATQLAADTTERLGILSLDYGFTQGGLHASQEPYKKHTAQLFTEGVSTIGKTKIAGRFRVEKLWADSLANYLAGYPDHISPYYYFATKAGKYQGQRYEMSMVLSHPVGKRIFLGLGADYDYRWTTGSVDPRPEDKKIFVNVHPSISMRFNKTVLGVEYTAGYERGTIGIDYQNRTFNVSTLYPDRFYYLNFGYGNIALKYGVINKRTGSTGGIDFHIATITGPYEIKADAGFSTQEETSRKNLDTSTAIPSTFFSRFATDQYRFNLSVIKTTTASVQQLILRAQSVDGNDANVLYKGSNYFAHQNDVWLQYAWQKNKNKFQYGFGGFVHFSDTYKEDMLAAHKVQYLLLETGVSLNAQQLYPNGDQFTIALQPSVVLPLSTEWRVPPTQENVFTKAVVYTDYYYNSTTLISAKLRIQYNTKTLLRSLPSGFFVEGGWLQSVSTPTGAVPPVANTLGSGRGALQLGFQVFL